MRIVESLWNWLNQLWPLIKPLLLVALGYLLKVLVDHARERLSTSLQHRHKVVELMVAKLHDYAEKYYIRTAGLARGAADLIILLLDNPAAATDDQFNRAWYRFGRSLHERLQWSRAIGGVFLRDYTGEAVISAVESDFNKQFAKSLPQADAVSLREVAVQADSVAQFAAHLGSSFHAKALRNRLRDWMRDAPEDVRSICEGMALWSKLLTFEVNSVYAPWYGETPPPELDQKEVRRLDELLRQLETINRIRRGRRQRYLRRLGVRVDP